MITVIEEVDEQTGDRSSGKPLNGKESPKWPSPNICSKPNDLLIICGNPDKESSMATSSEIDFNLIEGVEKLQAELQDFIKNKDAAMI
jgi:hypothetical protein